MSLMSALKRREERKERMQGGEERRERPGRRDEWRRGPAGTVDPSVTEGGRGTFHR